MRKQIGTKRYSTHTASLVGVGVIDSMTAMLYVKRNCEPFLLINPHSEQHRTIEPISKQKAEEFAKTNGLHAEYEQIVRFVSEPKQAVTFMLPTSKVAEITKLVSELNMSQSECLYKMLDLGYTAFMEEIELRKQAINELEFLST